MFVLDISIDRPRQQLLNTLRHCREAIAKLVGAEADELVLVPNATHALNVVLRNFEWRDGDVLIGGQYDISPYASKVARNLTDPLARNSKHYVWRRREHDQISRRPLGKPASGRSRHRVRVPADACPDRGHLPREAP